MTRYSVHVCGCWLAATYGPDGSGLLLTDKREDACSWVTHERAVTAARTAAEFFNEEAFVHAVEEPNFPRSWSVNFDKVASCQ